MCSGAPLHTGTSSKRAFSTIPVAIRRRYRTMKFRITILFLLVTAAGSLLSDEPEGQSQKTPIPVQLGEAYNLPTGLSPYFVVAADLNKDGYLDLVTSNTNSHDVTVFINNGNGTFKPGVRYPTGGFTPYAVAAGDLNGDGYPDLVAGNMFSVSFSVFFNKGDGTFEDARLVESKPGPMFPVIADLDNDGRPDIAIANIGHDDVSVYLNKGNGKFEFKANYPCKCVVPYSLIAADFNGDGLMDLATGNIYSANVSVMLNKGNADFSEPTAYHTDSLTQIIYPVDLNGDGKLDIVTGNGGSDTVSVLINKGDGTFKPVVNYPVKLPQGVVAADINNDGFMDLATANQSANTISVLLGNGDGTLRPAVDIPASGLYPIGLIMADLNNDGRLDIVSANSGSNDISIFLNGVTIPKIEEINPSAASTVALHRGELINPVKLRWNSPVTKDSLNSRTVKLSGSISGAHMADLSYSDRTLELRPTGNAAKFAPGEQINVVVSSTVQSPQGLSMKSGYVSSFEVQPEFGFGGFRKTSQISLDSKPRTLIPADLDGDGRTDLISLEENNHELSIYFNEGAGLSTQAVRVPTGGFEPRAAVVADFDGDGRSDIAVLNYLTSTVAILFNEGNRRFSKPVLLDAPIFPSGLAIADFTGDGLPDLAVINAISREITIIRNEGQRTFARGVAFATDAQASRVVAGDIDGDGIEDLATLNTASDSITLYKGKGDGTFQKKNELNLLSSGATAFLLRDINQDGLLDIVTANTKSDDVAVFLNTGDWGFNKPRYMDAGPQPTSLALADIDGDGRADLLVGIADGVQALINRGNGTFEKGIHIAIPGRSGIAAADFDGDGAIDFSVFDGNTRAIALYRNEKAGTGETVASAPPGRPLK
jgi:hypothetical protein